MSKLGRRDRAQQEVAVPFLRESEMRRCSCCTPIASRTLVTIDPNGREQFTCPRTKITWRFHEMRAIGGRSGGTYLGGVLSLRDGTPDKPGAGTLVNSAGHPLVAAHTGIAYK